MRVLVVEDEQEAAALLEDALSVLGYTVEVAYDGPSALQVAEVFHPDAALVDLGLPVMDGYELGRRLREVAGLPRGFRLLALTGHGRETERSRTRAAGFDAHLVKPVTFDLLQGALEGPS